MRSRWTCSLLTDTQLLPSTTPRSYAKEGRMAAGAAALVADWAVAGHDEAPPLTDASAVRSCADTMAAQISCACALSPSLTGK